MQGWQTTFLGMRELPHDLSAFELQAFFTFSRAEHELIQTRRGDSLTRSSWAWRCISDSCA